MDRERFARQIVLAGVGEEGQKRLLEARVAVVGLGALGSLQAELLTRAGVGHLILVDRDVVERANLQRQHLFTEADLGLPKVHAAARHLKAIWPGVDLECHPVDLSPDNVGLLSGAHVILDGTDNWPTRWLLNDFAVREGIPLIYGAALQHEGLVMPVFPGEGPCLACVFPEPREGEVDTCDRVGVLNTVTTLVATLQVQMALHRLLAWDLTPHLHRVDLRALSVRAFRVHRRKDCPVCVHRRFAALSGTYHSRSVYLCGRDTFQIRPPRPRVLDLVQLGKALAAHGKVEIREDVLRFREGDAELLVFRDGRALIRAPGITESRARTLYQRWVGE